VLPTGLALAEGDAGFGAASTVTDTDATSFAGFGARICRIPPVDHG
jgi:hypothetical protein